jgi:hypothetical protein
MHQLSPARNEFSLALARIPSVGDHLAGYAALALTPRDSGRRPGNLHRPRRYNLQLQRVFYSSAMISGACGFTEVGYQAATGDAR